MKIVTSTEDALALIDAHEGTPESFSLCISDSLIDPVGVNMAIITDRILGRGWEPAGFTQENEYRVCTFKELE